MTPQETAETAAEAIRALNHNTRPGTAEADVTDVYDLLAELALLAGRLPQLLGQVEQLVDDLVEADQVRIVDGPQVGDPVAAAAIVGHWLTSGRAAADQLAHALDAAQQTLTWAAPAGSSSWPLPWPLRRTLSAPTEATTGAPRASTPFDRAHTSGTARTVQLRR